MKWRNKKNEIFNYHICWKSWKHNYNVAGTHRSNAAKILQKYLCKRCTAICSGKQVLTRCTVQTRERGNRSCPNNKNQLSHYSWRGDSVQGEIPIDIVLFILFHPATTSLSCFVVSALNRVFANAIENLPWIPTYSICHVWEIVIFFFFVILRFYVLF